MREFQNIAAPAFSGEKRFGCVLQSIFTKIPQKRISICTSASVGSRRAIVVEASGDVALEAEKAFALYIAQL